MSITIDVTEEHIANGKPMDGVACAVALAIFDRTGKRVTVCDDVIEWRRYDIEPPLVVRDFVKRFDAGEKVEPFMFELDETLFGGA